MTYQILSDGAVTVYPWNVVIRHHCNKYDSLGEHDAVQTGIYEAKYLKTNIFLSPLREFQIAYTKLLSSGVRE